jgi:hypothetical protein
MNFFRPVTYNSTPLRCDAMQNIVLVQDVSLRMSNSEAERIVSREFIFIFIFFGSYSEATSVSVVS